MTKKIVAGVVAVLVVLIAYILWHKLKSSSANQSEKVGEHGAATQSSGQLNPASLSTVTGKPWGIDDLGAPDDPLPTPLPLPTIAGPIQSAHAADLLARQVLAGTKNSLPALITALQSSGIAIVGPADSVVARPAGRWQGMTMMPWEVRTTAAMVLPERAVTFSLTDLSAVLVASIPELKGAPLEQLIVNDVHSLADSQDPSRRFFGQFIAALGRNATGNTPYDLLAGADPQKIRFDGLQSSLIFRRLAIDILMLTGEKQKASLSFEKIYAAANEVLDWLVPTVYAQSAPPCKLDDKSRTIMDMVALGSQLAFGGLQVGEMGMQGILSYLEGHGFPGAKNLGTISAIVSTLLAYAQFIATYAALEVKVSMDAPPLVRTKKKTQLGERKQLTAIVKLNIGNAQMLNCFRIMLNAIGLDFSLPNDGPVKGAHVNWYGAEGFDISAAPLHGGSEAIVELTAPQQAASGSSFGRDAITDAITGEDGKVQVDVLGRPQKDDIRDDADEVGKSAKVRVDVALKGADLFGDLQEAAGTASGGLVGLANLPLSILYRAQWASAGHYSFPVRDWRNGPTRWAGKVTYYKVMESNKSDSHNAVHSEQQYSEELTLIVNVNETIKGSDTFGSAGAAMRGDAEVHHVTRTVRSGGRLNRCSGNVIDMKTMTVQTGEGDGTGTARVSVGISADGQYSITVYPEFGPVPYKNNYTVQQMTFGKLCHVENESHSTPSTASGLVSIDVIQGDGKTNPNSPDHISGSTEEKDGDTTRTLTWDLQRE